MFNKKPETIATSNAPTVPNRPIIRTPIRSVSNANASKSKNNAVISKECFIKGDISGEDDISIFGKVEGAITLKSNTVTIESSAKIDANIFAKAVNVNGIVIGNIEAIEKIVVSGSGNITGDMLAKKVILQDGSYFKGNVSMVENQSNQPSQTSQQSPPNQPNQPPVTPKTKP